MKHRIALFSVYKLSKYQQTKVNETFFRTIFISDEMKLLLYAYLKITFFVKKEIWQMTEERERDKLYIFQRELKFSSVH